MFELELLSLIIDNCTKLSVNKDKNHYRLHFMFNKSKIYNCDLNDLLYKIFPQFKFNYSSKTNNYYLNNTNAIHLLDRWNTLNTINDLDFTCNSKIKLILDNKDLFNRPKGKKLTEEELYRLEQLYLQLK